MRCYPAQRILVFVAAAARLLAGADEVIQKAKEPEGAITADRPDFTEGTETLAPGFVQLEGGVRMSRHLLESSSVHDSGAPFALLRIGVTRFAELRLGSDGYAVESEVAGGHALRHAGLSDMSVEMKFGVWDERRYLPAVSVLGALSAPVGSRYFSSGGLDPEIKLCWSKSLPAGFDASGNFNWAWETGEEVGHAASLSVGHRLWGGFEGFGEVYREGPIAGDEAHHWVADSGVSRRLGVNFQFDIEAGHTMNARTPAWFVGAGFAVRRGRI